MSRVVLIADEDTGRLVDIFGSSRESGRYARFAKRMLSPGQNPVLDYGADGGDRLEISASGANGSEVNILADVVNIPGELKVAGRTVEEMASDGVEYVLNRIEGTPGQIDVSITTNGSSGEAFVHLSLDQAVMSRLSLQQSKITAVGILKGEGDGVVSAAAVDASPANGSQNPVQSGGVYDALSGKADKSEMSVTPGTGYDSDKTTIQLRSGVGATVLKTHQSISGKLDISGDTRSVTAEGSGGTVNTYTFQAGGDTPISDGVARMANLYYVSSDVAEVSPGVYELTSNAVQRFVAGSGETSATFSLETLFAADRIRDLVLDVDNYGNASDLELEFEGLGTDFEITCDESDDLAEITTVDAGARARIFLTETAFRGGSDRPVLHIARVVLGGLKTEILRT